MTTASGMAALLTLPAKIQARDAAVLRRASKPRRFTAWERRLMAHTESCGRRHMSLDYAAKMVRVPAPWLRRITKGQPFRLDFGPDHATYATYLHVTDLVPWAQRQARGRA